MNRIDKTKLGMGVFLLSEANFFLLLIIAYAFYHSIPGPGPTASGSLNPARTAIYTVCLLASSVTIAMAGRSMKQDRRAGVTTWLAATIILGAVFLFGQGREYALLIQQQVTVSRNLFGSTFFTLTGFHGLHVFIGLCAIAVLLGLAAGGALQQRHQSGLEAVSWYWHFVDGVWVVIFSLIYIGAMF